MVRRVLTGMAVSAGIALLGPGLALGASIAPTTTADQFGEDPGSCALREAIQAANTDAPFGGCPAGSGSDTIELPDGTFGLSIAGDEDANTQGDLDTAGVLSIVHAGLGPATVNGGGVDRVFDVQGGGSSLTLSGLMVSGGVAASGSGGGIRNLLGTLTLTNVTVSNNVSSAGGNGGGIQSDATAFFRNTTISGNSTASSGGGLRNTGNAFLNYVTVAGNTADSDGDGAGAGGGVSAAGVTTIVGNTIVASNRLGPGSPPVAATPDCDGSLGTAGNNLIGNTANCGFNRLTAPGFVDLVNQDPQLAPLADNGGPTFTHALAPSSPAIGRARSGPTSCFVDSDQRGVPRLPLPCDIGAYELARCKSAVVNRVGTDGPDALTGTESADSFLLLGGNDVAFGSGGDDHFCGGDGNDLLRGGDGKDRGYGQAGADRFNGGFGRDFGFGGRGPDRLAGGSGPSKDTLSGNAGLDILNGSAGNDKLRGGPGRDVLRGGTGKDGLKGQVGDDFCNGGRGKDHGSSCETAKRIP